VEGGSDGMEEMREQGWCFDRCRIMWEWRVHYGGRGAALNRFRGTERRSKTREVGRVNRVQALSPSQYHKREFYQFVRLGLRSVASDPSDSRCDVRHTLSLFLCPQTT